MKIAVYGASGYTGRLVLAELTRRGMPAVLVGRDPERLRAAAAGAGMPTAETARAGLHDPWVLVVLATPIRFLGG